MGCFNATCAVSQLQIKKDEKVRLLFLYKQPNKEIRYDIQGPVNADDLYAPFCLTIQGKYDEYGGIDVEVKDWNSELILAFFRKKYPKEQINSISEDLLGLLMEDEKNKHYTFCLIKESVFQAMQSLPGDKAWLYKTMDHFDTMYQKSDLTKGCSPELLKLMKQMQAQDFSAMHLMNLVETELWKKIYSSYFKKNKIDKDQLTQIKENIHLHIVMNELEKIWTVQKTSSQESKKRLQKQFYKKMLEVI